MIRIAIDGACKGNGKIDCMSAAGVIIQHGDTWRIKSEVESNSTNQRGEMYALLQALTYCAFFDEEAQIITDSEYLFNTMTKEWYKGWESRGWRTSLGEPVKNQSLWESIIQVYNSCAAAPLFYHIKGHLIPDGGQAAFRLLEDDPKKLFEYYYLASRDIKQDKLINAQELSKKNNGFELDFDILRTFVALNGVADRIAVRALVDNN